MESFLQRIHFLSRFLISPKKIGSITPSSRFLVEALLNPIHWSSAKTIVELGAGTGVVTHAIEQKKTAHCQTIIFESDPTLHRLLHQSFPQAQVCLDANQLTDELERKEITHVDYMVSSLPFRNLTVHERSVLLNQVKQNLTSQGYFVAYQYSLQMKPMLQQYFRHVDVRWVPFNVPPAFVYICTDEKTGSN